MGDHLRQALITGIQRGTVLAALVFTAGQLHILGIDILGIDTEEDTECELNSSVPCSARPAPKTSASGPATPDSDTPVPQIGGCRKPYGGVMAGPELVLVPALVGLDTARAHEVAMAAGVVMVDPDQMPPMLAGVVVRQHPTPGARVLPGEPVLIWIDPGPEDGGDGGGGGGLPGPRSPQPVEPSGVKEPA